MAAIQEADLVDSKDTKNRIGVQKYVDPRVVVFHVGHHRSNTEDTAGFLLQQGDVRTAYREWFREGHECLEGIMSE